MKRLILIAVAAVAAGSLAAAQFYRWVDEKGNVEYRDTPPPQNAKKVEARRIIGNTIETSTPSFGTQQAVKNHPVTLWAYDCGVNCTNARTHLARRGVPYTEKDPRPDLAAFEKLTGGTGVPVLYVGSTRLTGYLASDWDTALDTAGYPSSAAPGSKPAAKATAKAEEKPAPAPDSNISTAPPPPTGADQGRPGGKR
jgi:hypothetical protein